MKGKFVRLCSLSLTAVAALCMFSGCNENSSDIEETTSVEATQSSSEVSLEESIMDAAKLHSFDLENGDDFAGAWKITAGEGSKLDSFTYVFDGHGKADLVAGTTGYYGTYAIDEDKKEFTSQLMFGINGIYTYEVSDESTIVLTNKDNNKTTTLTQVDSFDMIPVPDGNGKIDEAILGAWKSENGNYYFFDKSGIMYENSFSMIFTYYTYSAEDNMIHAVSNMVEGEEKTDFEYSVDGDKLTIDGYDYTKIPASELA